MQVRGNQFHWPIGLLNWTRVVMVRREGETYERYLRGALNEWVITGDKEEKAESSYIPISPSTVSPVI